MSTVSEGGRGKLRRNGPKTVATFEDDLNGACGMLGLRNAMVVAVVGAL